MNQILKKLIPEVLKDAWRQRSHRKDCRAWLQGDQSYPAPHLLKQQAVHEFRKEFGHPIFVETGTYLGYMIDAQKGHFDRIVSIELSEELYQRAAGRFRRHPNIEVVQGDSAEQLKNIVPSLSGPAIFWLDAHYSEGFTAKGSKVTPVLDELEIIYASPYPHAILIDDARLFTGEDDYPPFDGLEKFVFNLDPNQDITVKDDVIRISRKNPG